MSQITNADDWDNCADPATMLTFLAQHFRTRKIYPVPDYGRIARIDPAIQRKLRLVACGFCRRLWYDLPDGEFRQAIERTEQYADGVLSVAELVTTRRLLASSELPFERTTREKIHRAITNAMRTYDQEDIGRLLYVALSTGWEVAEIEAAPRTIWASVEPMWDANAAIRYTDADSRRLRAIMLRDVIPNPFDEPRVKAEWLSWNHETIRQLAETIYDEHRFADLPILADALEEAGCDEPPLLDHCRSPGPHIRGCWAVDLLRGERSPLNPGRR